VDFWQTVLEAEAGGVDADQHDAQLAATSHLPQIVASLLGDFLRSTRRLSVVRPVPPNDPLAASDPGLWTEILAHEPREILTACAAWRNR